MLHVLRVESLHLTWNLKKKLKLVKKWIIIVRKCIYLNVSAELRSECKWKACKQSPRKQAIDPSNDFSSFALSVTMIRDHDIVPGIMNWQKSRARRSAAQFKKNPVRNRPLQRCQTIKSLLSTIIKSTEYRANECWLHAISSS